MPLESSRRPLEDDARKRRRSVAVKALFLAIAVQIALLFGTVFVVVFAPYFREEPQFTAQKTIYLPQRELEHSVAVTEFQQVASPPVLLERITTSALVPDAMPPLPTLPQVDYRPLQTDAPLADSDALLGASGLMGGFGGLGTATSRVSFFGIRDEAERIVILFDISQSVLNAANRSGVPIERIKGETADLISQLNANTQFGLVQFSRQYDRFRPRLVTATVSNKESALQWLDSEFRTDGRSGQNWVRENPNGVQSVLRVAFAYQPDVIILLSDGSFQRSVPGTQGEVVPWEELENDIRRLQTNLAADARLHFVGFEVRSEDAAEMRRIVRRTGGRFDTF